MQRRSGVPAHPEVGQQPASYRAPPAGFSPANASLRRLIPAAQPSSAQATTLLSIGCADAGVAALAGNNQQCWICTIARAFRERAAPFDTHDGSDRASVRRRIPGATSGLTPRKGARRKRMGKCKPAAWRSASLPAIRRLIGRQSPLRARKTNDSGTRKALTERGRHYLWASTAPGAFGRVPTPVDWASRLGTYRRHRRRAIPRSNGSTDKNQAGTGITTEP